MHIIQLNVELLLILYDSMIIKLEWAKLLLLLSHFSCVWLCATP